MARNRSVKDKKANQHSRQPEHVSKKFPFFPFSGEGGNLSVVMFTAFVSILFPNLPATLLVPLTLVR